MLLVSFETSGQTGKSSNGIQPSRRSGPQRRRLAGTEARELAPREPRAVGTAPRWWEYGDPRGPPHGDASPLGLRRPLRPTATGVVARRAPGRPGPPVARRLPRLASRGRVRRWRVASLGREKAAGIAARPAPRTLPASCWAYAVAVDRRPSRATTQEARSADNLQSRPLRRDLVARDLRAQAHDLARDPTTGDEARPGVHIPGGWKRRIAGLLRRCARVDEPRHRPGGRRHLTLRVSWH